MDAKQVAQRQIAQDRDRLVALSHRIHAHPEIGWQEERACAWLAEILADAGFAVEAGCYDLPTAFVARAGSGPLHVAICAEYDALPEIGHACGHNIIAASAVGAGLAAAKVADELGPHRQRDRHAGRGDPRQPERRQDPAAGARRLRRASTPR